MELSPQIWLVIGFVVYYSFLQLYADIRQNRMVTYTKNKTIESLRTKYRVPIKTFRSESKDYGTAWFRTIWINEVVFKKKDAIIYTFHHEYYHLKHKHKFWVLFMRLLISITPLTIYFVNWLIFIGILLSVALITQHISNVFEKKANAYADKMIANAGNKQKA